jgi:cyclin B
MHAAGTASLTPMTYKINVQTCCLLPCLCTLQLMPETLYLTCNIIDRYLSIRNVTRKRLQLVGAMQRYCSQNEHTAHRVYLDSPLHANQAHYFCVLVCLQVGVTAMLIASKYEEIWAPEVNDFVYISDKAYTR